ncbi:AraC-like DNA-binding protein [Paenibacillus turicensis]|uniref:AraC-like DNA-binding protein n=1 Tax=Paenibacillus turicensis TaxID=160487 RepID=A0ABS4FS37_9BACL|nr:AraC-like DNA-binding protein [Paenibacillus turicensis]
MNKSPALRNMLSNLELDLLVAHYSQVTPQWRDIDYCPDYSKLYFITEGTGWIRINGEEYYPEPGQLVLMPEDVVQSYSVAEGQPYQKYWCHFNARIGHLEAFRQLRIPYICTVVDYGRTEKVFAELVQYANSEEVCSGLLAKVKLMELLSYYLLELAEGQMGKEQITIRNRTATTWLEPLLQYIRDHLDQDLTIQELATQVCLHPNYFIRMFKEQMGVPPIQYITRVKMERAKELLMQTEGSISEVACQVGFQDYFHFSKQFKKLVGMAPTEYRKYGQNLY